MPFKRAHPTVIRLPPPRAQRWSIRKLLARHARRVRHHEVNALTNAFAFCNDEERFARDLIRYKPNLWLFRTHQQRFCGDFIVVDMSCPSPEQRLAWAIDLKLGAPLKEGGGGAGVQFRNVDAAVGEISRTHGIITPDAPCQRLVGDRTLLLQRFGCDPPQGPTSTLS